MILNDETYVPSLRWRMGEYQALLRLQSAIKDRVVPLISIPNVEYDFELRRPRKSVHEHALPFAKRYKHKWDGRWAWITLHEAIANGHMNDGQHVFDFIFDSLRSNSSSAIPAVSLAFGAGTFAAVRRAVSYDHNGVGILLRLEELMTDGLDDKISEIAKEVSAGLDETDLIIDLLSPRFEPYADFATALISALQRVSNLNEYRNLVLVSTAIPESLGGLPKGISELCRHDWSFYRELLRAMPATFRQPNYGDCTIVHPNFTAADMRTLRPAGKIIYTTAEHWIALKGKAFRGNENQMRNHCQRIVNDPIFQFPGADYSNGDDYIAKCAANEVGSSNLTRWKEVGINHHITMVVNDLSTLVV